jgi:Flp pilus assembly pilin Flp
MFTLGKMSWDIMKAKLNGIKEDQSGQGMGEYVLIIVAIALAVMLVLPNVATAINNTITTITTALSGS